MHSSLDISQDKLAQADIKLNPLTLSNKLYLGKTSEILLISSLTKRCCLSIIKIYNVNHHTRNFSFQFFILKC